MTLKRTPTDLLIILKEIIRRGIIFSIFIISRAKTQLIIMEFSPMWFSKWRAMI